MGHYTTVVHHACIHRGLRQPGRHQLRRRAVRHFQLCRHDALELFLQRPHRIEQQLGAERQYDYQGLFPAPRAAAQRCLQQAARLRHRTHRAGRFYDLVPIYAHLECPVAAAAHPHSTAGIAGPRHDPQRDGRAIPRREARRHFCGTTAHVCRSGGVSHEQCAPSLAICIQPQPYDRRH